MMDRSTGIQQKMLYVTLESLMPEKHFLRDLDRLVDFSFIYDLVEPLYSYTGRRSIDPVVIVKMMLLGYLYGIDSERRLEQEVQINIAYRWFLGIDLDESVPDHSTLSQLRRRKFNNTAVFEEIFTEIVRQCIEYGLIDGKLLLTDSTHVRANARNDLAETIVVETEPSAYLKKLNEQAKMDGIYPKSRKEPASETKEIRVSLTDPECGFMRRDGKPLGFYYLSHQTCDSLHGFITDVYVTPGNTKDDSVHSARIQEQIKKYGFSTKGVCADKGYDSSEIHADMYRLGIRTFIPKKTVNVSPNNCFSGDDFQYDTSTDTYVCPAGHRLHFTTYIPKDGQKRYVCKAAICSACLLKDRCISGKLKYKAIARAYEKWASDIQHRTNDHTPEYAAAMRLRRIWCEGNFAHQKANHNLTRVRKRGLGKASVHCLLSATALNLKRMVRLLTRA